jgi:gamma-glutamylcyclotransferase (GGCT)/AIG2-like uncharacterized protein YtfP
MKIAAYGTLRGGLHSARFLTDRYGQDSVKVLGDYELPGFNLFTRPVYLTGAPARSSALPGTIDCPFVVPGAGTVKVTLLEISDNGAAAAIDRGEAWAYDKVPVVVPGFGEAFVYRAKNYAHPQYKVVPGGDYLKREAKP